MVRVYSAILWAMAIVAFTYAVVASLKMMSVEKVVRPLSQSAVGVRQVLSLPVLIYFKNFIKTAFFFRAQKNIEWLFVFPIQRYSQPFITLISYSVYEHCNHRDKIPAQCTEIQT